MNHKLIRGICITVIILCCFFTGIGFGFLIEGLSHIDEKVDVWEKYFGSANFLLNIDEPLSKTESDLDTLFAPFWETWDIVHHYYVDQPLDENALMEGAIRGMLESLGDPHTRYADPKSFKQEQESMAGVYEGIGAWVDVSGEYVVITSPISGSPAEEVGLRPKDQIIAINGEDMTGVDPNAALDQILGPSGTTVTLTIKREGEDPFDVVVERRKIETPMVNSEMLEGDIAYIQMTQFGDLTTAELREALDSLMAENPKGLILDLRNNGGGYLVTSVEAASEFLPKGELVLTEKDGKGEVTSYKTTSSGGRALDVPMVVLVNEGSASASEILVGALKYYGRVTVIGKTTYGKGSVQLQPSLSNGGAVSVTIARWYTPDGSQINEVGISPDIEVDYTEEDYKNEKDPQLDAAISFLNGELTIPENTTEDNGVEL